MIIRQAGIVDLPQLVTLFDGYRQFYQQPSHLKAAESFIRARLKAQDSVFIIALNDAGLDAASDARSADNSISPHKSAMGFIQLYPSYSSVAMQRTWILNDLFVAVEYRRLGVAKQLIEYVQDFAKSTNAMAIKLATAIDNEPAKLLYEQIGFKKITEFDYYTLVTN